MVFLCFVVAMNECVYKSRLRRVRENAFDKNGKSELKYGGLDFWRRTEEVDDDNTWVWILNIKTFKFKQTNADQSLFALQHQKSVPFFTHRKLRLVL